MAETVFILGAGASSEAGAPLMANFLDEAQRLSKVGGIRQDDVKLVLKARTQLLMAHSNAALDFRNLESLFAAFEMARLLGRLGTLDASEVQELPSALERVIADTLGATITVVPEDTAIGVETPAAYREFCELLKEMRHEESRGLPAVSVLTFNYDVCADHALYAADLKPNYRLGEDRDDGVSLLKLHGSLNWGYCDKCDKVTWWSVGKQLATRRFHQDELEDMGSSRIPLGKFMHGAHEYVCGHHGSYTPVIVPPTYNKGHRYEALAHVWKAAADELAEAENIYVVGFSLPPSDLFFRYFCALGMMGEAYLRRFWVFDPDPDESVERRFRSWLGQDTNQAFQMHRVKFRQLVRTLREQA